MASAEPAFELTADPPPLTRWEGGSIRINGTRMRFNVIITAYKQGRSPEQLTHSFPALSLANAYAVVAYYLSHREAVDAWLTKLDAETEEMVRQAEETWPTDGTRERIKARWAEMRVSDPH